MSINLIQNVFSKDLFINTALTTGASALASRFMLLPVKECMFLGGTTSALSFIGHTVVGEDASDIQKVVVIIIALAATHFGAIILTPILKNRLVLEITSKQIGGILAFNAAGQAIFFALSKTFLATPWTYSDRQITSLFNHPEKFQKLSSGKQHLVYSRFRLLGLNTSTFTPKLNGCTVYQGPGLEKLFKYFFLNNLSQKGSINLAQFIFDRFIPKGINKLILSNDYKKGEIHFESVKKGEITQVSENGHKDLLHSKLIFDQKVAFSFTNDGGIQFDGNSLRIGLLVERLEHYVSKIESYWLRKAVRVALRNYITEGLQLTVAITGFSNYSDCVRLHVELMNGEKEIRGDKGLTLSGNLRYLLSSFINWCDLDKEILNENFLHIQWEV